MKAIVLAAAMLIIAAMAWRPANYPLRLNPEKARYVVTERRANGEWRYISVHDKAGGFELEIRVFDDEWNQIKIGDGFNGRVER